MILSDVEIRKRYEQDQESCAKIANTCCCSETAIYNKLKTMGVSLRSRSEANQIFPDFIFIKLYNMGLSSSQIGRLLGLNPSTVTKRLHTAAFPLRSRCVARRIRYSEAEFKKYFMTSDIINRLITLVTW